MNIPMDKKLASMILRAMEIRESSYDKAAATEAEESVESSDTRYLPSDLVDYAEFYGKTLEQAAEQAAVENEEPTMASIIFYLMYHAWNDIQTWIKEHNLEAL